MTPFDSVRIHFEWLLLRANPRLTITRLSETRKSEDTFYRSWVRLYDKTHKKELGGMAEGKTLRASRIRAVAEAYEKICWNAYKIETGFTPSIKNQAHGFGVSLSRRTALLRAWAEYHERTFNWEQEGKNRPASGSMKPISIETPAGIIFIHTLCNEKNIHGTGYGLTAKEAADSALRSLKRHEDFSDSLPPTRMIQGKTPPQAVRITPKHGAWLECYVVY